MRNVSFAAIAVGIAMLLSPLALVPVPALAQTQTVVIDCLPPWERNSRFRKSSWIKHPSLSLNGFDCGDNCAIGYGLKQVLENVYGDQAKADPEVPILFGRMAKLAKEPLEFRKINESFKADKINKNSARTQARGFVALSSYVLENNDYDPTKLNPALPSANTAINNFRTALLHSNSWKMHSDFEEDGVKWTESVTNIARSIDFYLALENAYKHYDIDEFYNQKSQSIFSVLEKHNIMDVYSDLILTLNATSIRKQGLGNTFKIEPGNASLKIQVAAGYAAFVWQQPIPPYGDGQSLVITAKEITSYIPRSFTAAGGSAKQDREKYWNYQSDNGKYFWAEGAYYFHITLSDIIPFWHAARINKMLSNNFLHSYNFSDPFRQRWFLNPLHWLADISTPDGKTPPIDDGNKYDMHNAGLVRWRSEYAEDKIGEKFARIVGSIKAADGYSLQEHIYPVAISIPRRSITQLTSLPDGVIGNEYKDRKSGENGRQEVILRRTINGRQHYIFFNGESHDAIVRGEGHEQGDQMQLLYYVDDMSYLMDSGYDNAGGFSNSTWNHYFDHNVLTLHARGSIYNDGGVRAPYVSIDNVRKESNHQSVNQLYVEEKNNIDLLSANMDFTAVSLLGRTWYSSNYNRDILFINDLNHPYIIDINAIKTHDTINNDYAMYYHVNSEDRSFSLYNDNSLKYVTWKNMYKSNQKTLIPEKDIASKLFLQPFFVERSLYKYSIYDDKVRETYVSGKSKGEGVNIKTLKLSYNGDYLTTVAFIHALSNNATIPTLFKAQRSIHNNELKWQYFTRHNADTTAVDIFAVRGINASTNNDIHFSIPDANSFYLYLPRDQRYGFVRLVKDDDNIWEIDTDFHVNLQASIPKVDISGPFCIQDGNQGRYTSSRVIGGKQPYSYLWSYYRTCPDAISDATDSSLGPKCNDWTGIVTTKDVNFGGHNGENFKIRLRVTDSSSPARSSFSPELEVEIRSSAKGRWCPPNPDPPQGPDGKMDTPTEQMFALATGLLEAEKSLPEAYALRQNFPNPFNPSTEILFDLPEVAMVSLVVYDVLGREIARLVEGELPAGWHRARFDAGNIPSGVYLYRIQAGDFQDTGRMLLLK